MRRFKHSVHKADAKDTTIKGLGQPSTAPHETPPADHSAGEKCGLAVLSRPKFAKYVDPSDASAIAQAIAGIAEIVPVTATVAACRDPDDDRFLALAISGRAHIIVTGDDDLLTLHPFHGIAIVTPKQFVSESLSSIVSVAQPRHHT